MTIYATMFDRSTMRSTGPSVDSGFIDLQSVIDSLPDEPLYICKRFVSYQEVCFSDFPFSLKPAIDTADSN